MQNLLEPGPVTGPTAQRCVFITFVMVLSRRIQNFGKLWGKIKEIEIKMPNSGTGNDQKLNDEIINSRLSKE